jgi:hypothetical protein
MVSAAVALKRTALFILSYKIASLPLFTDLKRIVGK